ncbi:MAG: glycosyltransferase family 1 protein [Ignavibacteriaceae bacterium]
MLQNKRPLRAAYFAGSMKPGHDGVTRVLYKLIEGLNKNNIENIFFSAIIPGVEEQPSKMYRVPSVTFPLYKEYRFAVPGYKHFEQTLKEFNPDIIHINSPCPLGFAAVKFGLKYKIPVVATYHTHFASYARYYKIKALQTFSWNYFRSIYNKCECIYVPSKPIIDELQENGINNLYLLPHGVDTNVFNKKHYSAEWKRGLDIEGKYALLFAGRLVWEKDLQTLADAYKIINEQRNDTVFVLAGDGPVRPELEKMMPKALFLGYQGGQALSSAYASSDIFVFPSTTETFGNVTVEAMASGIPPVCAREGGAYGVINDGVNGLIAEPRDAASLAEKINLLLDHEELRKKIAEKAFNYAQTLSWDNIFNELFNSYIKIIDEYYSDHKKAA